MTYVNYTDGPGNRQSRVTEDPRSKGSGPLNNS